MTVTSIPSRFQFVDATTDGAPARLLLMGPTGSGKTFTALKMAATFGEKPGLIDTDNKRSKRYAPLFTFQRIDLDSFDPAELTRALMYAAEQGIDPLIIDTATPFWNGPDGMLEKVGQERSSFDGWKKYGPVEQQMMTALLGYPGHLIVNLESKVKYAAQENAKGKLEVSRVGMEPIQREGFISKFDIVFDMDGATARVASTCLCPELTGQTIDNPGVELAQTILAWLSRGAFGAPLNPITVAEWALVDGRSLEELRGKFEELTAAGQINALVTNPFTTGSEDEFTQIGVLLRRIRDDVIKAQRVAAAAAVSPLGAGLVGATV